MGDGEAAAAGVAAQRRALRGGGGHAVCDDARRAIRGGLPGSFVAHRIRSAVLAICALAGCAGGSGSAGRATAAPDLTGVWAVTSRYSDGSCPDVTGGSQAAMWTVNRDAEGAYTIAVQGDATMPTLTGKDEGGDVVLVGLSDGYSTYSTQWRMKGTESLVTGRALQTRVAKDAYTVKGRFGDSKKDVGCTVIWTVEAKKQGT